MKGFLVSCSLLLTLSLMVAACAPAAAPSSAGPTTWLDKPLDGAKLPLAPTEIMAHASDSDGVEYFEIFIDDTLLAQVKAVASAPVQLYSTGSSAGGGYLASATMKWNPSAPGVYTIRARATDSQGHAGSDATAVVTVGELPQASPTVFTELGEEEIIFAVEPAHVPPGGCAILHWQVNPPVDALLDGEGVPPEGEREVCVDTSTTYELTVPETGQTRTATLLVEGEMEPTPQPPGGVEISFSADRSSLTPGECASLLWSVEGGEAVFLDGGPVDFSGQREVCPQETTAYTLAVYVGLGPPSPPVAERELVIVVSGPSITPSATYAAPTATRVPPTSIPATPQPTTSAPTPTSPAGCPGPPVISSFTANPGTITAGQSSTLSWGAVTNATGAEIDQGIGGVGTPGSTVVTPATTTTYTMTATGCGGTAQKQVTVTVNPAVFSADLAITDLYPQTNHGPVWVRITNHGPGTVNNVNVQLSCQWNEKDAIEGTSTPGQTGPMSIPIGSLSPGQTQEFNTDIDVDRTSYTYDVTCTIQVPFNDPNLGNNSYSESF